MPWYNDFVVFVQVVELGVHIGPAAPGMTNISLLYTDVNTQFASQTIASFVVPSTFTRWARFSLKVTVDEVTVYFNCQEYDTVLVKREPQELVFDSASTLYLGQAGPIIKGPFEVSRRQNFLADIKVENLRLLLTDCLQSMKFTIKNWFCNFKTKLTFT